MEEELTAAWAALGTRMAVVDSDQWRLLGADVAAAYAAPDRHYHGTAHVLSVLRVLDELSPAPSIAQQLAAFVHDVIYDATASGYENEEASAVWAEEHLPSVGVPADVVALAARLTRATAGHQLDDTPGCAEFLDADLAILGADEATYDQYARNVRTEYAHVPDNAFTEGRAAVLQSFTEREVLFFSAPGQQAFESQARRNLARELATLQG